MGIAKISIIVPMYREGESAVRNIERLLEGGEDILELIVVEAGTGTPPRWIENPSLRWIHSPLANRAYQMNMGARCSHGEFLVFLHADTYVPVEAIRDACERVQDGRYVGGAFRFRLDRSHIRARLIEYGVRIRQRVFRLPYGDQVIFVRRDVFSRVGGYPEVPVLEDVLFIQSLKREGRLFFHPEYAVTSSRKWETYGYARITYLNWLTMIKYAMGVPLDSIAMWRRKALK